MTTALAIPDLFVITFLVKHGVPKVTIKLREEFKAATGPVGKTKMPVSSSSVAYFNHHLGDDTGPIAYEFYRRFFNKRFACSYVFETGLITGIEKAAFDSYLDLTDAKMRVNHASVVTTEEYRSKLRHSYNHELHSALGRSRFENPEFRSKMYQATQSDDCKRRRVESFRLWLSTHKEQWLAACNEPERTQSISRAVKRMWDAAKATDTAKLHNMIRSSWSKNYELRGSRYNKPEFQVATVLDECGVLFLHEQTVTAPSGVWYRPDFILPDKRLIIECYGDYWHASPRLFQATDVLFQELTAQQIWDRDAIRKKELESIGYSVLVVWEHDILNTDGSLKSTLKEFVNGTAV